MTGLASFLAFAACAADLTFRVVEKQPPAELAAPIREKLRPTALQLIEAGSPVIEFWLAAEVPAKALPDSPAKALDTLKPSTFIGAAAIAQTQRDYRDDAVRIGVYTIRFAHQPKDSDHEGSADFSYFGVLIPAALDPAPDAIQDYKKTVKTSMKQTTTSHPMVLSLRPASGAAGNGPSVTQPALNHHALRVEIPAKPPGDGKPFSIPFEIVYQGMGRK